MLGRYRMSPFIKVAISVGSICTSFGRATIIPSMSLDNKVMPISGLAKNPITVKCSRFVEGDFVFPGFITTDSKDAPQMTLKQYAVNKSISDLEFEPDMVK